jgi:hypothetical protein
MSSLPGPRFSGCQEQTKHRFGHGQVIFWQLAKTGVILKLKDARFLDTTVVQFRIRQMPRHWTLWAAR